MKNELESIVVMAWPKGFVAHIRFKDPRDDADIAKPRKYWLDRAIDSYVWEKTR